MCQCGDISTQACLHISTQAHLHNVVICPCGDVPVWRYQHTGSASVQKGQGEVPMCWCGDISTQAHLHMDRSQHCGDVPVWRCGDMPVWRYLHTGTSAPLLSPHRHVSTSPHCCDLSMWRCACVEIFLCCILIVTSVLVQKGQGEVPMCRCGDISTQACLHTCTSPQCCDESM